MRGSDRGKDFDDQWNKNRREGKRQRWDGKGPYEADKYLDDLRYHNRMPQTPPGQQKEPGGCKDAAILLLGLAGGVYWLIDAAVRSVT